MCDLPDLQPPKTSLTLNYYTNFINYVINMGNKSHRDDIIIVNSPHQIYKIP